MPQEINLNEFSLEWRECFKLLLDPSVSEIEANGPGSFFMKKNGQRIKLNLNNMDEESYYRGIENDLVPLVHHFNDWGRLNYIFEGPLVYHFNGQRVKGRTHIVLPPASDYPQITIAKKSTSLVTIDDIAAKGSMAKEMSEFLKLAMQARLCMVFSGGTGAGKTTMLEALTKFIPMDARIGVAEDTPELELIQQNVSYLHSVPWSPGMDANAVATLDWCVSQFNRARTDLLIIGETRGKEFASFLTAANSGMDGCLTTIHANNPKRCLNKMTDFALRGSERQPIRSINQNIADTVDVIVQLERFHDGRYRVTAIDEVTPTINNNEDASITTERLYGYNKDNDTFVKKANITENLRNKFAQYQVDTSPFQQTQINTVLRAQQSPTANRFMGQAPQGGRGIPMPEGFTRNV